MGRKADAVVNGVNMTMKIITSILWILAGIGAFSLGHPIIGVVAVLYLVYLWIFGGRWLIY
jgi:hypothetical protein